MNKTNWNSILTREYLFNFYIKQQLSIKRIADLTVCDPSTVKRRLIFYGISLRLGSESHTKDSTSRRINTKKEKGYVVSEETKKKISLGHMGKKQSLESNRKRSITLSPKRKGSNNPAWKGGNSFLAGRIRHLFEYKYWRFGIFQRDNFTCRECGQRGGKLEAHHMKYSFKDIYLNFLNEYSTYSPIEDIEILIELAKNHEPFWEKSTSITLCKKCHDKVNLHHWVVK